MSGLATVEDGLRVALRRLAKAVVIITTCRDGDRHAMAATAVSELSLTPPSILVCVNRNASMHETLAAGAPFCVNILHTSQESVAQACAGPIKGEARFESASWGEDVNGVPILQGAQASISCVNDLQVEYATHRIFIGRVCEVRHHDGVDPLIYVDGRYTGLRA